MAITSSTESVYQDLLSVIQNSSDVQALVAAGNIHGYETEEQQVLGFHESGDMPHLEFWPVPGGQRWLRFDCDNAKSDVQFKLRFLTDTERMNGPRGLWALDWAIHRAFYQRIGLIKAGDQMIDLTLSDFGPLEPWKAERQDGVRGWCAELTIAVQIQMTYSDLTP